MKKYLSIILVIIFLSPCLSTSFAEGSKGGVGPCLASCCIGPRVGLEMNDGRKIRTLEWLTLVPVVNIVTILMQCYEAYQGKTMSEIAAAEKL
jgi:hypothetical protein